VKSTNDVAKLLTMICDYCCQFQFDFLSGEYMVIVAAIKTVLIVVNRNFKVHVMGLDLDYRGNVYAPPD